jgi:hypothetical protein
MKATAGNTTMKCRLTASILALLIVSAQGEILTTGTVTVIDRDRGVVRVRTEQNGQLIDYYDMDKAVIQFNNGKAATLADVQVQQPVTVTYTIRDNKYYVARLAIPDPKPAVIPQEGAPSLSTGERRALDSKAAKDDDITTQPGSKARIDNDITTKPGSKDPRDPDITKKTDR